MIYIANYGTVISQAALNAINSFVALSTTPAGSALTKDGSGNFVNTVISGGSGTVSSFAFTNGSGFTGTVTNPTTTPTLALTTSLTATSIPFITTGGAMTENALNLRWDDTNLRLQIGSGSTTSTGLYSGYSGVSGFGALWSTAVTPATANYALLAGSAQTFIAGGNSTTGQVYIRPDGSLDKMSFVSTAGRGPSITAGTATTNVNALNISQTWNNAAVAFTALDLNVTNTASASGSLLANLRLGGSSMFSVDRAGLLVCVGGATISGAQVSSNVGFTTPGYYRFTSSGSRIQESSDGVLRLLNNATNDFGRLQFGGTTSSFPALKRNATGIDFRLADDSAYAPITVSQIELGAASDTTVSRSAAGQIAVEGIAVPTISSTNTITNKRNQPRVVSAASYTTDTGSSLDVSTCDLFVVTAQAGALKFNNPGGTPVQGEKLMIRIKDDGTARALTYDTQFRASSDLALPTTTIINKTLYMGFVYNSTDTKWDLIAVLNNF